MHDTLANGKTIGTLNIIDDFNRELLSITIDTSVPAQLVIRELETLIDWRGMPEAIRSDNAPEFVSVALSNWCKVNGVSWIYIQPRKSTQNSLIESFDRTFRHEILDSYLFESLAELRKYALAWAWMYNNERPHAALGYLAPTEFLLKYGKLPALEQRQFPTLQQDSNSNSDWNSLVLNVAS